MLICPICQSALTAHENSLRCIYQHSFDRARQGYINLLPVQHKNSRAPGDNPAMVQSIMGTMQGNAPMTQGQAPEQINDTPYQAWIFKFKTDDNQLKQKLLSAEAYQTVIGDL